MVLSEAAGEVAAIVCKVEAGEEEAEKEELAEELPKLPQAQASEGRRVSDRNKEIKDLNDIFI
jgi:hypothetical protein